jgi:hypothetical protein
LELDFFVAWMFQQYLIKDPIVRTDCLLIPHTMCILPFSCFYGQKLHKSILVLLIWIAPNDSKIIAVTNLTNYNDNLYFNNSNGTQTGVRLLNLTGKYIIPGLFDTHAHVAGVRKDSYDQATSENMLDMLLDYGITTIRNPAGPTNESVSLRGDVQERKIRGPEMLTAGRLLNTPELAVPFVEKQVTTEEDVKEEVRN